MSPAPAMLQWAPMPAWGLAIDVIAAIASFDYPRRLPAAVRYLLWAATGLIVSLLSGASFAI